ncbi:MAG: ATP-binding protein [Verrucomicrobia bacterium]|nr:ATP-binding protein [Verrucomicrobiota bacterium]
MLAWEEFITQLESQLGPEIVDEWLRPLKILKFDAANLYLEAKEPFQIHWFEEHVRPLLKEKFLNNNSRPIRVHLSIPGNSPKTKTKAEDPSFEIRPDPLEADYTFSNFLSASENLIAHKLLLELTSKTLAWASFNPILIYGPKGSGKTHLLTATAHELKKDMRVFYVKAETFTEHVVQAIRLGKMQEFRHAYREIDVLIIDDIHIFSRKNATQEEFFHTFNTLHTLGQQIILSANVAPSQLIDIEPRLISRFEWGITLGLEKSNQMEAILDAKAKLWGLKLAPAVIPLILSEITSRPIEALQALALRSDGTQIEELAARLLLKDFLTQEQENALTAEQIVKSIAAHFGIKPEDLLGKSQMREFALPRQIAMYACRERLKMPFQKIGELFGRDHSTVMASVKQIQKGVLEKKRDLLEAIRSL